MRVSGVDVEFEFLYRLVVRLEVQVVPLVVGTRHDGVVTDMRVAGSPPYLVRTSGYRKVVAEVRAGVSEHLSDPVISLHILIEPHIIIDTEIRDVIIFIAAPDHGQFVLVLHEVIRAVHLDGILVRHPFLSPIGVVAYREFAAGSALSSDEDYAVRSTGTVDGCREGIFQDIDALDVGSRNVGNAFHRETVHNIKR